jgi:hypothetical protein
MTEIARTSLKGKAVLRWLFAAAFIFAVVASGLFTGLMNKAGLFYLMFGSIAAALMGFTGREIAAAFRQAAGRTGTKDDRRKSAYFWEATARNAWILGGLGSALNFIIALSRESNGIIDVSSRMIQSLIIMLYGLVLAVICLVPAMKLAGLAEKGAGAGSGEDGRLASEGGPASPALPPGRTISADRVVGYGLFGAVLALTVAFILKGQPPAGGLPIGKLLLHAPAYLVVIGGAIALALFAGAASGARSWTLGFAMTGLIGLLLGLIQALFGFVHRDVGEIATAVAFIISTASLTLLGLVAVAAPLEDREVMDGRREGPAPLSRFFWVLLPLLTFIFLILTFIMVVTPLTKPG